MKCEIYALGRAGRALELSLAHIQNQPDILFLTVPDDVIAGVAQKLTSPQTPLHPVERGFMKTLPRCVAHLSGAHSYKILNALKGKTALAQFHPLAALTGDKAIPAGTQCAISSDQEWARDALTQLARSMGLIPTTLNPQKATQYHAAAVITGNLSLGLVSKSIELMQEAGIDPQIARVGLAKLLRSAAENLEHKDIPQALTGPIARKDIKIIQKHLEILDPEVKQVYQTLSGWLGFTAAE